MLFALESTICLQEAIDPSESTYLYSLDHFFNLKRGVLLGGNDTVNSSELPPLLVSDDDLKNDRYHGRFLVINARVKGETCVSSLKEDSEFRKCGSFFESCLWREREPYSANGP